MWNVLAPGEGAHGPGAMWANYDACAPNEGRDAEAAAVVDYFCPSALEAVHLCVCCCCCC